MQNCVSVIIPVYNAGKYLTRCLDSVVGQTLQNIEIICVNDCSQDNSLEILREYEAQDERIKIINFLKNMGESCARNAGLKAVTGEYIAFLDNDDWVDADFYEKLYVKAKEDDADIVKGGLITTQYDGTIIKSNQNKTIEEKNSKLYFFIDWWTAIYRASMIKENKIDLLEDYPLGADMLFLNKAVLAAKSLSLVNDVHYNYIRREDSGDSKILSLRKIESVAHIFELILDNLNAVSFDGADEQAYYFVAGKLMHQFVSSFERSDSKEGKQLCAETITKLYSKIKNKDRFLEFDPINHEIYASDAVQTYDCLDYIGTQVKNNKDIRLALLRMKLKKEQVCSG